MDSYILIYKILIIFEINPIISYELTVIIYFICFNITKDTPKNPPENLCLHLYRP